MLKRWQKGFTLLELLVVISIIGILIGLGAVSYTTAQKKGRDSRRLGDMRAMSSVYEQYYSDPANSYQYPTDCTAGPIAAYAPAGWPDDPKNSDPYVYSKDCSASGYCFCAFMEGENGNSSVAADATCSGLGGGTAFYCVKNQQ
jgi:prepilin-type N-terminal cleavage/methylation domain-containing protein